MDNLEHLSDDDLRRQLLQYGFPNLPITDTTRKILIKKLRNHLSATKSNLRKTTSLVSRYSSGEDSDNTDNSLKGGAKPKRARMTVSGTPGGNRIMNHEMPPPSAFSNYSPSVAVPKTQSSPSSSLFNRSAANSSGKKSSVYVSPVIINDSDDDDLDWSMKKPRTPNTSSSKNLNRASSNLSARSTEPFNISDTSSSSRSFNGNNGNYNQADDEDTNTTTDYTKRFLQLREENLMKQNNLRKRTSYQSQRSDYQPISENDIVTHAELTPDPVHIPLNMAIKNFINRLDAAYGFKQTFVPMVLLAILIIFFMILIVGYATISPNIENALSTSRTSYVTCDPHDVDASYACIDQNNLESSLNLLKVLAPELQRRAIAHKCSKLSGVSNVICVKEFWHFLSENQPNHQPVLEVIKDVHNIEYLIDRNKDWGIRNVNANGEPVTLDQVMELRAHQAECFAILKPKLPILCTVRYKMQTFFFIIGSMAIVASVIFFVRKFYQFVLQVKEKRRAQVSQLIGEIISSLMEKTMLDKDNPILVITHLRDKVIEPKRRSELQWAWNEAINYLERNDSRIQFEVKNINGEDFKVIRWIDDTKNLSTAGSVQSSPQQRFNNQRYNPPSDARVLKKWMCPAFDKSNKIKDPPTNCLKIRQMFDKYEATSPNLQLIIQDTILHKLSPRNCKIYDIQIDQKSCCVYIKSATCEDAGIVHEEINGWWLDGRLVVVKFLKQEKYHQRFPEAINACTIMYPSSTVYLSTGEGSNGHNEYYEDDEEDFE